jgi:hypothetical protein
MKGFVEGVTKAITKTEQAFEKYAFKYGLRSADPGNISEEEVQQAWRDIFNTGKEDESITSGAARTEFKQHIVKNMQASGMSEAEAKKWVDQQLLKVKDLGDKVRETVPKVEKAGRFMLLKFLGAIAVVGGVLTVISGVHRPVPEGEKMLAVTRRLDAITEEIKAAQAFEASEKEFNMMTGGLEVVQSAPLPEPMPIVVAAKAEEPVIVKVTTPSGTHSFQSNVGQVYRNVPQAAKHEIARGLSEHRDQGLHKEFTVDSPIGSAHFKY